MKEQTHAVSLLMQSTNTSEETDSLVLPALVYTRTYTRRSRTPVEPKIPLSLIKEQQKEAVSVYF